MKKLVCILLLSTVALAQSPIIVPANNGTTTAVAIGIGAVAGTVTTVLLIRHRRHKHASASVAGKRDITQVGKKEEPDWKDKYWPPQQMQPAKPPLR